MGRFQVGWQLGLRSWRLLRSDKELVLLPVLSAAAVILLAAVIGGPGLLLQRGHDHPGAGSIVLYALALVAVNFAAMFFAAALVAGALQRLNGGDPTVRSSLAEAWTRRVPILKWSLLATVVSLVINMIEERLGPIGRLFGWAADVAWAVASAFALPVIIVEGAGPVDALKKSSGIVRNRWGASAGAYVGASIVFLPAFLVMFLVVVALAAASPPAAIVVGVVGFAILIVLSAAVSGIARAAMYQYATTGQSPLLDPAVASQAFQPRRTRAFGGNGGGFSGRGF